MTLEEKIDNEFQRFFLDMMHTSRENIFSHSREIEIRKSLKKNLLVLAGKLGEEEKETLLVQSNVSESAFRFLEDEKAKPIPGQESEILQKWVLMLCHS